MHAGPALRVALACLLLCQSLPAAFAATVTPTAVTGTVQLDRPGPVIPPELYGQFMEQLGTGIDDGIWVGPGSAIPNTRGYRNDVLAALKALKVPLLRWPGGCYADIYHWRSGIGPRAQRPVTLNRWWGNKEEHNGFGTHEFFEFAELVGARTFLNVNVGTGTPREAAEWVEYITSPTNSTLARERRRNGRDAPWKIDFLGIGNEPNGCGGRMRAEWFADQFRQYVGFIAPHGGTTFIASGPDATSAEWTRTTMEIAGQHLDAFSMHYYTLPTGDWTVKGPATGFDEAQWRATFEQTYRIEPMIREQRAIMDEFDPEAKKALVIGEWGTWYDPTPGSPGGWLQQQNSLRDGLVAAANFNIFHRHAERLRVAGIAQMVNVLQAMILTDGPRMVLTPTYHAFALYRPFQGATALPLALHSPAYGSLRAVDGSAARGADGTLHLALVNLDPRTPMDVSLALPGWHGQRVSGQVLTADAIDAHNTFDAPDVVRPAAFDGARVADGALTATLPAKSLVVLALEPID
ncbi:MAG: alpha-N-arabinofuranosidase [Proteobacteria bacterium]|nr:alpha-N-arabinofuranosidase [Pseudomonadota bacterium]